MGLLVTGELLEVRASALQAASSIAGSLQPYITRKSLPRVQHSKSLGYIKVIVIIKDAAAPPTNGDAR